MGKDNYKITDDFSFEEFNQTDFGRIYYNVPLMHHSPKTIFELARLLKNYNRKKMRVTIRNTGHSTNGQTLTNCVQISLEKLKKASFNEKTLEATVGAGTSWHELLKSIKFPKYCIPIFPNNPHQEIHVGGTAAVGGIGVYSSVNGGFWNHVKSIKLVTMTGRIITCSTRKNPELLRYSLGGFGRIGVISEITLKVVRSKPRILMTGLFYHSQEKQAEAAKIAAKDPFFDGVFLLSQANYSGILRKLRVKPSFVGIVKEISTRKEAKQAIDHIKQKFNYDFLIFSKDKTPKYKLDSTLDLTIHPVIMHKKNFVYSHPNYTSGNVNELEFHHPWSDYAIPPAKYADFMNLIKTKLNKYNLAKYLLKSSILSNHLDLDTLGAYCIRKLATNNFPLTTDLQNKDAYYFSVSVLFAAPQDKVDKCIKLIDELTAFTFKIGGKRYLYGTHNLSKSQVEKQFGKKVISEWNRLKSKLDPNHLLNIGVIPNLDGL